MTTYFRVQLHFVAFFFMLAQVTHLLQLHAVRLKRVERLDGLVVRVEAAPYYWVRGHSGVGEVASATDQEK